MLKKSILKMIGALTHFRQNISIFGYSIISKIILLSPFKKLLLLVGSTTLCGFLIKYVGPEFYKAFSSILEAQKQTPDISDVPQAQPDKKTWSDEFAAFLETENKNAVNSSESIEKKEDFNDNTPPLYRLFIEEEEKNKIINPHSLTNIQTEISAQDIYTGLYDITKTIKSSEDGLSPLPPEVEDPIKYLDKETQTGSPDQNNNSSTNTWVIFSAGILVGASITTIIFLGLR